jgi:hypothetical protein
MIVIYHNDDDVDNLGNLMNHHCCHLRDLIFENDTPGVYDLHKFSIIEKFLFLPLNSRKNE